MLDGTVLVSGEIPRVTGYEHGLPKQVCRDEQGNWVPDPLVLDERYLCVDVKDHGIVVFSACSHAGIVNVLTDAAETFGTENLYAVMGGLHLSGPGHEPLIEPTVADIGRFGLQRIVPGHCTGWRATHALVNAFGDTVIPEAVGQTHRFGA
ncbi:MAG: MBL fold metallo-hydrolase, partial [Gammaproteobacteria bacterium]|nr:MBL fold metallo-hydrolase [Gammaproteobacteria bacterium]